MSAEILYSWGPGESRLAVVRDGRLVDLAVSRPDSFSGAVFLGRVAELAPKLGAVFVALGQDRPGFLQGVKGLTQGAAVLVQVKADAHGEKGPSLTTDIALSGRYLSLTPTRPGVTVSRKLGEERARRLAERLGDLVAGDEGVSARPQAANASDEYLAADLASLRADWQAIQAGRAEGRAPALLWRPDPLTRLLADHSGVTRIVVDDDEAAAAARLRYGSLVERHAGDVPVLDPVEDALAAALSPVVMLPCGGRVAIEATAALTAIDVDSGPADPAEANTQAVAVIARQIRLRNLAGQMVVDFVSGGGKGGLARLVSSLKQAVAGDPVATHVIGTTPLGLVELTRERRGPSLTDLLCERSVGPSADAAALAALRQVLVQARHLPGPALQLTAACDLVAALSARPQALAAAESRLGRRLTLKAEGGRSRQDWTIEVAR
jgi:Rne/Rng family ribonuclease